MAKASLTVLRLQLNVEHTSAPYNQFSVPIRNTQRITICSFFSTTVCPPPELRLVESDGTLSGYLQCLRSLFKEHFDVIHAHTPHVGFLFILAASLWRRSLLSRSVFTVHTSYPNLKLRNRLLLFPVFLLFQKIVFCGQYSRNSFPGWFLRLCGNRSCIIPNGANVEHVSRIMAQVSSDICDVQFRIVSVGRLIWLKRPDILLRAFSRIAEPEDEMIFVGDGILLGHLQEEVRQLGIETQVQFIGVIPREQVYELLLGCNLYVSSSELEGMPVAAMEAMACARPVLLSDIPPHRELIGSGHTELLVLGDEKEWAYAIKKMKALDSRDRALLGSWGKHRVKKQFSLQVMLQSYQRIYQEVSYKKQETADVHTVCDSTR